MDEGNTVRIGIVGLGGIAHFHSDHLVSLRDEGVAVELAGGMDIAEDAREKFSNAYDAPAFEDVHELFNASDAVIVTTPNCFHEQYVVAALEAGLDVFVEKPLAHTVESAQHIADAAETADGFCMVGFHNRFAPEVQALKAHVDDGRFGDVYHVDANYIRRRGVPGHGSWFTDAAAAGGGALVDIGAHAIDLALHVMDFPEVVEIAGTVRSRFGARDDYTALDEWGEPGDGDFSVDDSANALIRCEGGQTIALDVSWAANRPADTSYVVQGDDAGAEIDRKAETLTVYETEDLGGPQFADTRIQTTGEPAHRAELREFVNGVATDEPPTQNTVEEALTVQHVIEGIYRAEDSEKAVEIEAAPQIQLE